MPEFKKDVNSPAHEDYLTLEHFGKLREEGMGKYPDTGTTVAFLVTDDRNSLRIKYGRIFSMMSSANGMRYSIMERNGHISLSVPQGHTAVI